jgi:hypothetical protein
VTTPLASEAVSKVHFVQRRARCCDDDDGRRDASSDADADACARSLSPR